MVRALNSVQGFESQRFIWVQVEEAAREDAGPLHALGLKYVDALDGVMGELDASPSDADPVIATLQGIARSHKARDGFQTDSFKVSPSSAPDLSAFSKEPRLASSRPFWANPYRAGLARTHPEEKPDPAEMEHLKKKLSLLSLPAHREQQLLISTASGDSI